MSQSVPEPLREHERVAEKSRERVSDAAYRAWDEVDPGLISESWEQVLPPLAAVVAEEQARVADSAVKAARDTSVVTGQYRLPESFPDQRKLVGYGSEGVPLEDALYSPAMGAKKRILRGASVPEAMLYGATAVMSLASTIVADTGRESGHLDLISRNQAGYVRVVEPGACSRCIILAGKFFRWNAGFLRHPACQCEHMPAKSKDWAVDEGWYADPYDAFRSMSTVEQRRVFGEYGAQAIRDGADIYQVVNVQGGRAGLYAGGRMTYEGTSRHGSFRQASRFRHRLTPYGIYGDGSRSREQVIQALKDNGYILPGGQVAGGVIRGNGIGRTATRATREAWATGVRVPTYQATMTAAERRRYRADRDWQMVQMGINPRQSMAAEWWQARVEGRPEPPGVSLRTPLNDQVRADAEAAYRRYVLGLDGGDPALPKHMRPHP